MGIFSQIGKAFGAGLPKPADRSILESQYRRYDSLVDFMPVSEYLEEERHFLFSDGRSRMAGFELKQIPTEGKSGEDLEAAVNGIAQMLKGSLPEEPYDPWVVQVFTQTESDHRGVTASLVNYIDPKLRDTPYTKDFIERMSDHIEVIHKPGGCFFDEAVTEAPWRARQTKVYMLVYRRFERLRAREDFPFVLEDVMGRIEANLMSAGVRFTRLTGEMYYRWMKGWFTPNPAAYGGDVSSMLAAEPWVDGEDALYGRDLAESLFSCRPESNSDTGMWYFDGMPHAALSVGPQMRGPDVGQFTGEINRGPHSPIFALTDKLPDGTAIGVTITAIPQGTITNKIESVDKGATAATASSRAASNTAEPVLDKQISGDFIYPTEITFFLRGEDERDLTRKLNMATSLIGQQGVNVYSHDHDPLKTDTYLRALPCVYIPQLDRKPRMRARPWFSTHIAAVLPIWGRSEGTGNHLFTYWNRGASPLLTDPLNKHERISNAHAVYVGPSGSGKSASLVGQLDQVVAVYNPKIFVVEKGGSFKLWGRHAKQMGKSVAYLNMNMNSNTSIPPFADLYRVFDEEIKVDASDANSILDEEESDDNEGEYKRDRITEAERIAVVMVTAANAEEIANFKNVERAYIREALTRAAKIAYDRPKGQSKVVRPSLVGKIFAEMALEPEYTAGADKLREFSATMSLFCSGLNGHLFDRESDGLPDVDITILEMGQAIDSDNRDTLSVGYMAFMAEIMAQAEQNQNDGRHTILLTDEGHVILNTPLLAAYSLMAVKMFRKLGVWYWVATQDLKDIDKTTQGLFNSLEFWWMLYMKPDEVKKCAEYINLTPAQQKMMMGCQKLPGKYIEGVLISKKIGSAIFRAVNEPFALALAQTDPEEKKARREIMDELDTGEPLDAVREIARRIREKRLAQGAERS